MKIKYLNLFGSLIFQCVFLSSVNATMLDDNELYEANRLGKYFVISLKQEHRVISTSDINGGQTNKVKYLINFQSMEAADHTARFTEILSLSDEAYHQQVADEIKLDASKMAIMGTAANINNLVHISEVFKDIKVDAFLVSSL